MNEVPFEDLGGLMVVDAKVFGPRGDQDLRLVVDTGATVTLIAPEILNAVGYSVRDHAGITTIRSAVATERGYLQRVSMFRALGHERPGFLLHAHDLPDGYGIDGLLGVDFLNQFNYEVRPRERRIRVAPLAE